MYTSGNPDDPVAVHEGADCSTNMESAGMSDPPPEDHTGASPSPPRLIHFACTAEAAYMCGTPRR